MGSSESAIATKVDFPFGNISISLSQGSYNSGERITGIVNLELRESYSADKVRLEFKGAEKCYFDIGDLGFNSGIGDRQGKVLLKHEIFTL